MSQTRRASESVGILRCFSDEAIEVPRGVVGDPRRLAQPDCALEVTSY